MGRVLNVGYTDIEQGGPAKYSINMSLFIMILQCQGFFRKISSKALYPLWKHLMMVFFHAKGLNI